MKITVIPDKYLSEDEWKKAFMDKLGNFYNEADISFQELKEEYERWPEKPEYKRIKEYTGNPLEVANLAKDTEILVVQFSPVSKEVFDTAKNLKLVACNRSTPVNIDVQAATDKNIPVINAPGRNADSVADFTMGLLLAEIRHIARSFEAVRNGTYPSCTENWRKSIPELRGKVIGIVGFGKIGSKVAERAKGFGMKIVGYDPFVPEETMKNFDTEKVDLNTLLQRSDFVTIHMRLTPQTTNLIGEKELALMKKTSFLINTSRGEVIDENALYNALVEKKIAGAALDVFVHEPMYKDSNNKFIHLNNITFTPHMAGPSDDMFYRGACILLEDIARFLRGEKMENVLNPDIYLHK
ncbi:MAG: 2-hydroxyacid dehydrogenase [Nitrososphaeria archaeon]|jgi:D-3-phosphoglycerate dehydrogenase